MPNQLAKAAITDKIAHASQSSTVFHAARMTQERLPAWAPASLNRGLVPAILCDRKSGFRGPGAMVISLHDGTLDQVTCKKCRAILDS